MDKVKVGIIGLGGISRKHINELVKINECEITAICDINREALNKVRDRLKLDDEHCFTNYKDLIDSSMVEVVEICTPNYLHIPMATYAVKAGKPINIEKPLSVNLANAIPLKKLLEEKPIANMMCFSYRFYPAVRFAKWILQKNMIGNIISVNVEYLKSSAFIEKRRLDWRFVKKYAGSGVIGDLGVHLIDMAEFLCGKIHNVTAVSGIVVKKRKRLESEEYANVETEDYCNFLAEIGDGATASFVISRCAIGNQNTVKYDIFGTEGVISFNLNNPDSLFVCIGEVDKKANGLHLINVPDEFKITQEQTFVDMVTGKECAYLPTVKDGLRAQKILDALLESAEKKCWVST